MFYVKLIFIILNIFNVMKLKINFKKLKYYTNIFLNKKY